MAVASTKVARLLGDFRSAHRERLRPSWGRALWWLSTRLGLATSGHVVAALAMEQGASLGAWLVALPALVIGGMATGSVLVAVHDLAHGTFFPSKRANRVVGHALATVFFVDYGAFRRAHLQHHRAPQSLQDPNFAFVPPERLSLSNPHGVVSAQAQRMPFTAALAWLRATQRLPHPLRTLLYLPFLIVFYPLLILSLPNELTLLRRNFRDRRRILPLIAPFMLYLLLGLAWPTLAVSLLLGVWLTFITTFMLVVPHLFEEQLIFSGPIARNLAALNISDVRFGPFARWFTGGISDYHSAHHLDCSVPIYQLPLLGRWVDTTLAQLKATPVAAADWSLLPRFIDHSLRLNYGKRGDEWHLIQCDQHTVAAHSHPRLRHRLPAPVCARASDLV